MYLMVASQGLLGYGLASVYGAIPAELFQGRGYGTIFGTLNLATGLGAGIGPWLTGAIYDRTGSYAPAFSLAIALSLGSIVCIWLAAPRKVRVVAGQAARLQARQGGRGQSGWPESQARSSEGRRSLGKPCAQPSRADCTGRLINPFPFLPG